MEKKLIKILDGIEIFLNEKNYFECRIENKTIQRASLSSLESVIVQRRSGVVLQNIYSTSIRRRQEVEVIEFTNKRKPRLKNGELERFYNLYLCNEDEIKKIDNLIDETNKLNERWADLINSIPQVHYGNFERILKMGRSNQ